MNNRLFKFRIWDKKENRYRKLNDLSMIGAWFTLIEMNKSHADYVIEQFTGLFDKDGKEIFEGDIVYHANNDGLSQVSFFNGAFILEEDETPLGEYDTNELAIKGNIHKNMRLLR